MPRIHFYFPPIQFTDDLEDDDDDSQQVCNVSNSLRLFLQFLKGRKEINQSGNIGFLCLIKSKNISEQSIYCFNWILRTIRQKFKLYNGKKLNWTMFLSNSYYFNPLFKKLAWIKTLKHDFISVTLCLIWSSTSFIFQQDEESDEPEDPEGFKVEIILFVANILSVLLLETYSFLMPFLS